jgi:hypothetical protein
MAFAGSVGSPRPENHELGPAPEQAASDIHGGRRTNSARVGNDVGPVTMSAASMSRSLSCSRDHERRTYRRRP